MPHPFTRLAATALLLAIVAPSAAEAACSFGRCQNAVWAPGARTTSFGGISGNARLTPYGVTSGRQTAYGVTRGRQTAYGVSGGHQTSYGVSAGHQTSYGVSAGHQTAYGVTSGRQTSYGVMGASCRPTAFGVVCSDMRLKRDVVAVGRLENGLALYRYRYLWSDQLYVGVMAQEVAAIAPDAVRRGADRYLRALACICSPGTNGPQPDWVAATGLSHSDFAPAAAHLPGAEAVTCNMRAQPMLRPPTG